MKTQQSVNLMEGLLTEIDRVKEMITEYKSLPKNAGMLAATMMSLDIDKARSAIAGMDTIQMMASYKKLREYEN
jgi:arginine repressor